MLIPFTDGSTYLPQTLLDATTSIGAGSAYDMQIVGDRLYWLAGTATTANTELRSIPPVGGRVTVRTLPGAWTMVAWPWLVTAPSATGTPVELFNLDTGARLPVHAPNNKMVTCSPTSPKHGENPANLPTIFQVNWLRRGADGRLL
jgi:hypothetical protein